MNVKIAIILFLLIAVQSGLSEEAASPADSGAESLASVRAAFLLNPIDDTLRRQVMQQRQMAQDQQCLGWETLSRALAIYLSEGFEPALPWLRQCRTQAAVWSLIDLYYPFNDSERAQIAKSQDIPFFCSACGGTHRQTCVSCQGLGLRFCPLCQGKGVVSSLDPQQDCVLCSRCQGWGTLPCTSCQGSGFYRCQRCAMQITTAIHVSDKLPAAQAALLLSLNNLLTYLIYGGVDLYSSQTRTLSPLQQFFDWKQSH